MCPDTSKSPGILSESDCSTIVCGATPEIDPGIMAIYTENLKPLWQRVRQNLSFVIRPLSCSSAGSIRAGQAGSSRLTNSSAPCA